MKKRITALLAAVLLGAALTGCEKEPEVLPPDQQEQTEEKPPKKEETEEGTMTQDTEIPETEARNMPEPVLEKETPAPETPEPLHEIEYDPADWTGAIEAANARANVVNGRFTDPGRHKFLVTNGTCSLLYDLSTEGSKGVEALCNADGTPYFTGTMDASILLQDGTRCSASASPKNGRMNSHRLGYYYYDFRFSDQLFVNKDALNSDAESGYDILKHAGSWNVHDNGPVRKQDDGISYKVADPYDPYIYAGVKFSAEEYDAVRMTIRTETASTGEFYIIAGSYKNYSADQRTSFSVTAGEWTTVTVPLSVIPDYHGDVKGFRVDCGAVKDEKVEIRELRAVKTGTSSVPFALERIYHTYSDKMHEVLRIVATNDFEGGGRFETETAIPADTVEKILLKNADGESADLNGFDFSTAEFVGFDIKEAGIFGVILPDIKNNGGISVSLRDGDYIVTRGIDMKQKIRQGEDVLFGQRIYTSSDHDFEGLRHQARIERNPLGNVTVYEPSYHAAYMGYDALAGYYRFTVDKSGFNRAYYREPDKQFAVHAEFCGDGVEDRTVYLLTATDKGGELECAAVLDENHLLLPIPVEVCKNFCGEYEEKLFDPEDTAYGEAYLPLTVGKNERKRLTVLHLYQNWGKYPLKQLSSIAFHIPYYHLSVGVTETNCIAPYFVYAKDAWTLPDFRSNSAPLWSGQPQHTSAGRLYFLRYTDAEGNAYKSESQSASIVSAGPVYADIGMEYLSDDGKIRASYRHAETAQTDENRTYYRITLDILDEIRIADFRRDFSFFTFDGRSVCYRNIGWLNEAGSPVTEEVNPGERVLVLGKDYPYYDYYGGNVEDSVNFGLIVRRSDIRIGGERYDGNFVLYDRADGSLNTGSLSLDLGETVLKKGDRMEIEIILLPWGYSTSKNDKNVLAVRKDACVDPYRLIVAEGEEMEDSFIPSVRAKDGRARFTLEGGRNTAAVRVFGFGSYERPRVRCMENGRFRDLILASSNGYDGYQVYRDGDGTYSFSFNVDMDRFGSVEIEVSQ